MIAVKTWSSSCNWREKKENHILKAQKWKNGKILFVSEKQSKPVARFSYLQVVILLHISEAHDTGTEAFWIRILRIPLLRILDNYTNTWGV